MSGYIGARARKRKRNFYVLLFIQLGEHFLGLILLLIIIYRHFILHYFLVVLLAKAYLIHGLEHGHQQFQTGFQDLQRFLFLFFHYHLD